MISSKMVAALNEQIKNEQYSSQLYLAMAAWAELKNLRGFGHWLRIQADEERGHAIKILDYLVDLEAAVTLKALDQPPTDFKSVQKLFDEVLEHEKKVSDMINKLYAQAIEEKDYRSQIFLQWFVNEQIEEEANASEIRQKLIDIGDKSSGVYWVDKELKKREAK
ncbi:MAG TPA: ferritin [Terriglobia bacterium]|nr:ferritin [Terriglobia bacterium]